MDPLLGETVEKVKSFYSQTVVNVFLLNRI